jgi:hypothetical protein
MNSVNAMVLGESGLEGQKIEVLPNRKIEIEVLDRSGKPVSGENKGILSYGNNGTFSGSSFHAIMNPFIHSEVVIMYDYMTGDAGMITVKSDDTRVKLQLAPTATIRGRLVSEDGAPKVWYVGSGSQLISRLRQGDVESGNVLGPPFTDFDGRFEMVGIVGQNYEFCFISRNTDSSVLVRSETIRVEVKSPDLIDLGDIMVLDD